jgi:hypothetical protein
MLLSAWFAPFRANARFLLSQVCLAGDVLPVIQDL